MWDDYMGFDWYALRQYMFFIGVIFFFASAIGMTEGYPWHYPITFVGNYIVEHSTTFLIVTIVLLIAGFRFIMYKEGY